MKFLAISVVLLAISFVNAKSILKFVADVPVHDRLIFSENGDGDLSYTDCSTNDDKTRMELKNVTVTPKPLKRGQDVSIKIDFDLKEQITSGEVKVKLNYGQIPIIDETLDMCDLITEIGKSCPVKPGPFEIALKHNLPDYVPTGKYKGEAKLKDQNGKELACVDLQLNLH